MKSDTVSTLSPSFPMKWWDQMPWSSFSEFWALSQIFHCSTSLSSRGLLVPLHFLPKDDVIYISEVIDISPGNLGYSCDSSSPAFLMMHFAYKLNKQGDNIQPWRTPFPIWNQSAVPCPALALVSWPAYRFLKRQVRWSGIPNSFRIFHNLWWSTQSKALV